MTGSHPTQRQADLANSGGLSLPWFPLLSTLPFSSNRHPCPLALSVLLLTTPWLCQVLRARFFPRLAHCLLLRVLQGWKEQSPSSPGCSMSHPHAAPVSLVTFGWSSPLPHSPCPRPGTKSKRGWLHRLCEWLPCLGCTAVLTWAVLSCPVCG